MDRLISTYRSWPKMEMPGFMNRAVFPVLILYGIGVIAQQFLHWTWLLYGASLIIVAMMVIGWALVIKKNYRNPKLWTILVTIIAGSFLISSLVISTGH